MEILTILAVTVVLHALIGTGLLVHHLCHPASDLFWRELSTSERWDYWFHFAACWSWALVKTIRGDIPEGL